MSEAAQNSASERGLDASKVGHRLRAERERLGIGLRELARRVGVSPSLVSQIELDRVNPSVSTLYAIVTELGMTMSDVFAERVGERVLQRNDGLVESPVTRRVLNLASGVRWERLTADRDRDVLNVGQLNWIAAPPGKESLQVKLRHGPETVPCRAEEAAGDALKLRLDKPDPGIAPGQHAVFYDGETCLGGGIIA